MSGFCLSVQLSFLDRTKISGPFNIRMNKYSLEHIFCYKIRCFVESYITKSHKGMMSLIFLHSVTTDINTYYNFFMITAFLFHSVRRAIMVGLCSLFSSTDFNMLFRQNTSDVKILKYGYFYIDFFRDIFYNIFEEVILWKHIWNL